ncbi:PilZ domain-containing protein [Niveispirillum sp.]|uniref:PilZ domain-containing protein n=1 Tax=Niveispirillum sp. TaxID=1917217 RepID=UPI001B5CAD0C|nr:PilZ domain-containing protein [Niveispirillum sp.]MBP7335328.1 PilZ domain-containing protein [Niveispirillum sp.]
MQVATMEPAMTADETGPIPDEVLNAKLIACWQAALNTDDPDESQRWVDMAEWLAHRGDQPAPTAAPRKRPGTERRHFPRVPVRSPALLTLEDRIIRGETINLSRTGACFACTGPEGVETDIVGVFSVHGWVEDRAARIVALEPGQIRLTWSV